MSSDPSGECSEGGSLSGSRDPGAGIREPGSEVWIRGASHHGSRTVVIMSDLYAAAVRRRRERYARRPDLRRRLRRPVISVGNLAAGGRGKTPLVAAIVRDLLSMGERPSILSRGYRRTRPEPGVVVVRDADGIRSDLARAGDEPLMLARTLEGACVLVCPDRYLAGRPAE